MIAKSEMLAGLRSVVHGFSTRNGGVSTGAHASLNLGYGLGDSDDHVRENRARLRSALGLAADVPLVEVEQVHGARIVVVEPTAMNPSEPADGLVVAHPKIAIAVRTADCAPILIASGPRNGRPDAIAAVHAGWRGTVARILPAAVECLEALGGRRSTMQLAIGPTIGGSAFEVSGEVIEAARRSLEGSSPPCTPSPSTDRWLLDLRELLVRQLEAVGIGRDQVDLVGGCTYAEAALYFSHRRDRGSTGRHLSVIALS